MNHARLSLVLCAATLPGLATGRATTAQDPAVDRIVTTSHQVGGGVLRYTARAGYLPIADHEAGEVHAHMFFMAYTLPRAAGAAPRPLTFLWNGGPGSSSSLVHLLGFGPRRLGPGDRPIDNDGTWLGFSDLVFVDPIGTGYSRPVKAEYGPEFYQTRGDAESVAEFIRVYRNRFDAHDAPLYLTGESYGVTRAAGVADALERRGIRVSGAILIGLALPLGQLTAEQRTALNVPTYTAAAFAHRRLAADLQPDLQTALRQAERWSVEEYLPALARATSLSDAERSRVIAGLARFTGIEANSIDRRTLAIPMPQFSELLLRAQNLIVGRYESRMTAPFDPEQQKMYDPTRDPSLRNIIDNVAVTRYLRSELKFESDLNYQGPFGGGYPPPATVRGDWMSVRWNRGTPAAPAGGSAPATAAAPEQALSRAMTASPSLRVLSWCGYYDLVCSYFVNEYIVGQLDPMLKARVSARAFGGGHAIYTEDAVRLDMMRDAAAFMQARPRPSAASRAPMPPAPAGVASGSDDDASTTSHVIKVGGLTRRYSARAGTLPIRLNETGEIQGRVFYVAYTAERTADQPRRPLTFLWNGGPGSNSVLLHLIGFGPRRIRTRHDSPAASCECELQDNEATWLEHSDLVFVDPVGTGFSRPARAEHGAGFYNTLGDIASIAEFVRVYLTRYDAWDAPLFLAGESFGTWRASGVAEALEQRGRRVAGVILISGGVQLGPVVDDAMRAALFVPTRAAAALHHGRLGADLQADPPAALRQIEEWARTEYGPALQRVNTLTDPERDSIVAALARFTGLDATLIDRQTLIVGRQAFAEQLLSDRKQVLARFDTRAVDSPAAPSARADTVNRYLRTTLGYKTDLAYQGAEEGFVAPTAARAPSVGARWNYNQAPPAARQGSLDGPPGGPQPWLRRAMAIDPALKALVAAGLYDSLNSCAANAHLVSQLEPGLRSNVTAKCYDGGHAMYDEPAVRIQVTKDVAAFVRSAISASRPPAR